ncbi:hypothetical protein ACOMHN_048329 [Nucella lapillus]
MMESVSNVTVSNASWNTSVEQLLLESMGPRGKDTVSAILLSIIYGLIFLTGSLGNISTCIVIVRNSCMQTTTNYYLFSLALSDLLLLFFGLPPELFSIWKAYPWPFGEAFCYLRPTVLELTSYASVLTITAFTVERYIAICRPLLSQKIAVLSRAVKIIIGIWIVSLLVALPYAVHTRLFYAVTWPSTGRPVADSLVCSIPSKWLEGRMTYMFQISTFLFFLAPVTLIICLYILIGIAVRRSPLSRVVSSSDQSEAQVKHVPLPQQPRRVIIRMLVAVTVAFIICWAPFHTQRLMVLYVRAWTPDLLAAQSHIFYISGVLYFVSCTVNPILYNVISRRYRVAFRRTIFSPCTRGPTTAYGGGSGGQPSGLLLLRPRSLQRSVASLPPPRHGVLGLGNCPVPLRSPRLILCPDVIGAEMTSQASDVMKEGVLTRAKRLSGSLCSSVLLKLRKVRSDEKPTVECEDPPSEKDVSGKVASRTFSNGYYPVNVVYTEEMNSKNSEEAGITCSLHSPAHFLSSSDSTENNGFIKDLYSNYSPQPGHCQTEKMELKGTERDMFYRSPSRRVGVSRPLVKTQPLCRLCLSGSVGARCDGAVMDKNC